MRKSRAEEIAQAYYDFEAAEPNISTERLLAVVEDATGADAGDVCEALEMVDQ